jgi:RNA polymerase sigma factor (sigma-70 family)
MATPLRSGISGLFRRLAPPNAPDAPADATLLTRFVHSHDEPAFTEIVRRHGAMVLSVCRRRLGNGPDADDAYQVTFLALARDARKIGNRESLAGWLHRVAHFTALKLCGRAHRHQPEPLTTDPAAPMDTEPHADLKAVIDEELSALPDKFRSVAVLCLIEGCTNTEAADRLGIPKGTVDSRLNTAKTKLRERLLRRGIAAATLVSVETVLSSGATAASMRAATLAADLIPLALNYAAGVPLPGSEHLTTIANGVKPTMNTISTQWLTVAVLTTGLLGAGGFGVYRATADDKPQQAEKKVEQKKLPQAEEKPQPKVELQPRKVAAKTADDVQGILGTEHAINNSSIKYEELNRLLNDRGVTIRLDTPSFVRRQYDLISVRSALADTPIDLTGVDRMTLGDLLREALGQLSLGNGNPQRLSYRIKGNQILIVPEYAPAAVPGAGGIGSREGLQVSQSQLIETMYGEPVTVRYKNMSLPDVIEDLQDRTGANIVLKPQGNNPAEILVTANFNDTRLLTVLKIVGNMCELKPVVIDNVYYLTNEASAAKLQKEVDRDLFGEQPPAVPAGFVTDGYNLYPKTADMKPVEEPGLGLGVGGGVGGGLPIRVKPVPAPEPKNEDKKK